VVDFAVHQPDREDGGIPNPHFHVLCPIRPIEQNGKWGLKQRRVYELDEDGNRIRDANGKFVFNAVPTTDWGSPETLEHWRQTWAELCNAKFAEKGLDVRIDHRSYERQGVDLLPTIHEGATVRAILQSQSQLKAIYKDNADTIVGNCDTTLFLGGKEKTTLKEISEILGKETIDSFNTSETRGRELSHGLNYQKLGKQLMTEDEIAVMDGGKCILQLRGVRPFFSDKFDITKHPKYKYLSDADPKNAFDMEKHLKRRPAIVKPDEVFDYYEIDAADLQEDADHEET
jgi:ATP-dependent exoDNAse (exonuclease V) alpha subunit